MNLSIIIPTKDRGNIFDQTLDALATATEGLDVEIIVVNDSTRTTPTIPKSLTNVNLVQNDGRGVASARNRGAAMAKFQNLLFMDDDFLVERKHILSVLESLAKEDSRIVLFNWEYPPALRKTLSTNRFGRYLEHFGFTSLRGWLQSGWREGDVFELDGGASYFLPIRKEVFLSLGGYDERFTHAGAEDYDFVQRARKAGIRFYLDSTKLILHNERDRFEPTAFLERKKRNGETIAIAARLGYTELAVNYPAGKYFLFKALSSIKPLLIGMVNRLPDYEGIDFIYYRMMNVLLAIYFFEGYTEERP